nr:hypothetical protein [Leucobacter celer]
MSGQARTAFTMLGNVPKQVFRHVFDYLADVTDSARRTLLGVIVRGTDHAKVAHIDLFTPGCFEPIERCNAHLRRNVAHCLSDIGRSISGKASQDVHMLSAAQLQLAHRHIGKLR